MSYLGLESSTSLHAHTYTAMYICGYSCVGMCVEIHVCIGTYAYAYVDTNTHIHIPKGVKHLHNMTHSLGFQSREEKHHAIEISEM